ncbi:hypothetical protein CDD82_1821 [Ophiocordyceps australis]|uniref:Ubiquitin-like modifier HUB1 n=1 Tax=Ophiocordyceps australis TaxID=1399860 RepID=A0A2C5XXE3_9HYPO|nr:hypothetical protein CDD82_1821 [Ophiocordyceps australis]
MADSSSRRSRSRSPARRAPRSSKGFRWKNSARGNDDSYSRHEAGRRREYRDRSRDRDYARTRDRERSSERKRGYQDGSHGGRDRGRDGDGDKGREQGRDVDAEGSRRRLHSPRRSTSTREEGAKKEKKAKKAAAVGPGQEMIVVNVNDRLGTKSAIPCLGSDTVGQFKLMVAARIGRETNQIMLRRQGERPFKDHLTLDDYGVSNGVQLDLEIDTAD